MNGGVERRFALALLLWALVQSAAAACLATASAPACSASASQPAREAVKFRRETAPERTGLLGPYELLGGLALIGAAVGWWRLRQQHFGKRGLDMNGVRVVSKCRLSAKSAMYVVQHRNREIMLVESEHGVTVIRDDSRP